MLERSPKGYGLSVHWLSAGRRLDAAMRIRKLLRAFEVAKRSGADHYVISGDLTESGTAPQFEQLAETLHQTDVSPERITLVPGNHDAYGDEGEWTRAIEGPLRAFARASCGRPGKVVDLGDACILPIDVTFRQPVTRSAGVMTEENAGALAHRANDTGLSKKLVIAVVHHPPYTRSTPVWHWIDGMCGGERMMDILDRAQHVHVLHGHLHKATTRNRIFGATAIVEDPDGDARVRLYAVRAGALESAALA
jgi:3',5'-cyclic AMP phosphodiesterase CpdA